MKKAMVVLSMFLFPALAVAAYAAQTDEKCPGKAAFEEKAKTTEDRFIIQDIMLELSDPLANMSDEQAAPLAACYVTYNVAGKPLAQYVREQANAFEAKGAAREAAKMRNFSGRIETLNEKAALDKNLSFNNVLFNIITSFEGLSNEEAAPKAEAYTSWFVNGHPFVDVVDEFAQNFTMDVEIRLNSFTSRVESLAK